MRGCWERLGLACFFLCLLLTLLPALSLVSPLLDFRERNTWDFSLPQYVCI